jgi:hypothetical protein
MKKSKIAGLIIASILVLTPAAIAGGLGDIRLPDSRFNAGGIENSSPVSEHSGAVVNFYGLTDQSHARGWYIAPLLVGLSIRLGSILTDEIRKHSKNTFV